MTTRLTSLSLASLLVAGAALTPALASTGVRVCTLPGSPTAALDKAVAREAFRTAGIATTLAKQGIDDNGDDDGVSAHELAKSLERDCDVIAGFPRSALADASGSSMTFSQGYLHSGYVDVALRDAHAPAAGTAAVDKETVAATYSSPAQLIAAQQKNVRFDLENTSEKTIDALATGRAQRAIVWYPSVVAYRLAHPKQQFRISPTSSPYTEWELVFAFGPGKDAVRQRIDAALSRMSGDGRLAALTHDWTLPATVARATGTAAPGRFLDGAVASAGRLHGGMLSVRGAPAMSGFIKVASGGGGEMPPFDSAQVQHGKKLYADACAKCHGEKLEGITAPALSGPAFAPAGHSHLTVGGIYQYMSTNMPADRPGKMTDQEYADLMAFLLSENGYDPAKAKLTADTARASTVPLIAGPRQ